jgi:hypothetical protein
MALPCADCHTETLGIRMLCCDAEWTIRRRGGPTPAAPLGAALETSIATGDDAKQDRELHSSSGSGFMSHLEKCVVCGGGGPRIYQWHTSIYFLCSSVK